jgi:hypothetical protein
MRQKKGSAQMTVSAAPPGIDERRQYRAAREAFEYACSILAPFHHPGAGWQGRSLHHVSFGLVRGNFPHLADEETHALLDAVTRVFAKRHTDSSARGWESSAG